MTTLSEVIPINEPFGLPNYGSTCYINASLQMLFPSLLLIKELFVSDKKLAAKLAQFCADHQILPLLDHLKEIFPEKNITRTHGDVELLVTDILEHLKQEGSDFVNYFRIKSKGSCHQCNEYNFKQNIFVLPLLTYMTSADNTNLNDLILQWLGTKDMCTKCKVPVELHHSLPNCLMMLIDQEFVPKEYLTIDVNNQKYKLVAFTKHYGDLNGGHETCVARRGGQWYLFDDAYFMKFKGLSRSQYTRILMYLKDEIEEVPISKKEVVICIDKISSTNEDRSLDPAAVNRFNGALIKKPAPFHVLRQPNGILTRFKNPAVFSSLVLFAVVATALGIFMLWAVAMISLIVDSWQYLQIKRVTRND